MFEPRLAHHQVQRHLVKQMVSIFGLNTRTERMQLKVTSSALNHRRICTATHLILQSIRNTYCHEHQSKNKDICLELAVSVSNQNTEYVFTGCRVQTFTEIRLPLLNAHWRGNVPYLINIQRAERTRTRMKD